MDTREGFREIDYFEQVKLIAEGVVDAIREGNLSAGDASDRIHEDVEDSQWIIYAYRAKLVACFYSDNEEAWRDVHSELPRESMFETMAYYAMEADVRDALPNLEDVEEAFDEWKGAIDELEELREELASYDEDDENTAHHADLIDRLGTAEKTVSELRDVLDGF